MRRLIIMRHAKSAWANHNLSDHDRPLNARGRRSASRMAQHFLANELRPSVVLASTAQRVRETLDLMLAEWSFQPVILFEKSLYLASSSSLHNHIGGLHDSWHDAMILGHNPGLSEFVSQLAGQPIHMPTAAVAVFESPQQSWTDAIAAKDWLVTANWRPRELTE